MAGDVSDQKQKNVEKVNQYMSKKSKFKDISNLKIKLILPGSGLHL